MTAQIHWDVSEARRAQFAGVSDQAAEQAVEAALKEGGRDGLAVSVIFVTDEALCELHGRFLDDDSPTDVITFDLTGDSSEGDAEGPGAELYVSVDAAVRCAPEHSIDVESELLLYVAHGTLHLCGHDDHDEEERRAMRLAEVRVLASIGIELDRARHERT